VKKILLTGASGFLGRYCAERCLEHEVEIHTFSRNNDFSCKDIIVHPVDLFDAKQVRTKLEAIRPTYLLHAAWLSTPGIFWASPENIQWLQATINLLTAFGECGGERALGIGTCAEYDWSIGGVYDEHLTPLLPSSIYGQCKLAASQVFSAIASVYGFSAVWARLFFPYGIGEPSNKFISYVINSLRKGEIVKCSHGRQKRDFLYIEDAATMIVDLMFSEATGAYNIGSGVALSIRDIVDEIVSNLGGADRIQFSNVVEKTDEPALLIADTHRIHNAIPYRAKVNLSSGIARMINVVCDPQC
jgi:nucleoside-diphosphate-sugar epimerase